MNVRMCLRAWTLANNTPFWLFTLRKRKANHFNETISHMLSTTMTQIFDRLSIVSAYIANFILRWLLNEVKDSLPKHTFSHSAQESVIDKLRK